MRAVLRIIHVKPVSLILKIVRVILNLILGGAKLVQGDTKFYVL